MVKAVFLCFVCMAVLLAGCETTPTQPSCTGYETRAESIPADAVKQTPETDLYPVVVSSVEFEDAIPLPGPVNTAGVEDACVVSRDGNTMFLFFTPDASVPAEEQLFDCVTGVWWCERSGRSWTEPFSAPAVSPAGARCTMTGSKPEARATSAPIAPEEVKMHGRRPSQESNLAREDTGKTRTDHDAPEKDYSLQEQIPCGNHGGSYSGCGPA